MKKVWMEIELEWAYRISELWYYLNEYILKHSNGFNKIIKKVVWDRYCYWTKRFYALYDKLELPTIE